MVDIPTSAVELVARDSGTRLQTPRDNAALQLARALSEFSPAFTNFTNQYGAQLRDQAEQRAIRDAAASEAMAFGDAVREGRIEATQNPWYIRAYEQESANIRAEGALNQLSVEAQSWEERSNPQAFAARWARESGAIGQEYRGRDQLTGFNEASERVSNTVIARNTSQNVERIVRERAQNVATLAAQSITDLLRTNPQAGPAEVWAAMEQARQSTIATGGTQSEWDAVAIQALTSAAYNNRNPGILDAAILYDRGEGQGIIANLPGISDQAQVDRFRINQMIEQDQLREVNEMNNRVIVESQRAETLVYEQFPDAFLGGVNSRGITAFLREQGITDPRVIASTIDRFQETVRNSNALNGAAYMYDTGTLDLVTRAARDGWSPELQSEVQQQVLDGRMSREDGEQIVRSAVARNNNGAGGGAVAAINTYSELNAAVRSQSAGVVYQANQSLTAANQRALTERDTDAIEAAGIGASAAHLAANPEDWQGAITAARTAMANAVRARLQNRASRATQDGRSPQGGGGSPVR